MITRRRNAHPEADVQRQIVAALRTVLPKEAIVHHSPNEQGGGPSAARRQAILVGMGVHPGWSDIVIVLDGRPSFMEVKSRTGRLSDAEADFSVDVRGQGLNWELVRSVDDALAAIREWGLRTRVRGWQ